MSLDLGAQSSAASSGASESIEDNTEDGRARKRRREFAHNLSTQLGLAADALDDFADVSTNHYT